MIIPNEATTAANRRSAADRSKACSRSTRGNTSSSKNHAIHSARNEVHHCLVVRELNAGTSIRGAAGLQAVNEMQNDVLLVSASRPQGHACRARVSHHGDAVV